MVLSKNLVKLMKEKGLNFVVLAKRTGISKSTLHGWSTGRRAQDISELKRVAEVLEISLHELAFGAPDPFDMDVRKGPISGQIADDRKEPVDKESAQSGGPQHNEMLNGINGIANGPIENPTEIRSIREMKLHLILKTLMEKHKESARGAAKACKIPLSTFAGYLKPNKRQIDPDHLLAIARHYGVSIDYLFGHQQAVKFDMLPTKKIFSKWVKLTIEDISDDENSIIELAKGTNT